MIYNFFSLGLNCFFFFFVIDWPWPRDIIASYDREKGKERERETDFYEYKCAETICVLVFCLWMLFSFNLILCIMKICIILRISSVLCVCLYLMFIQQGLIFIYIFFFFSNPSCEWSENREPNMKAHTTSVECVLYMYVYNYYWLIKRTLRHL